MVAGVGALGQKKCARADLAHPDPMLLYASASQIPRRVADRVVCAIRFGPSLRRHSIVRPGQLGANSSHEAVERRQIGTLATRCKVLLRLQRGDLLHDGTGDELLEWCCGLGSPLPRLGHHRRRKAERVVMTVAMSLPQQIARAANIDTQRHSPIIG
jgi:hypothetical protein